MPPLPALSIAGALVPVAAMAAGVILCLRLGRMRAAARLFDAGMVGAIALLMAVETVRPGLIADLFGWTGPTGRPSACVTAAAIGGTAFAWQSARRGLRGLALGATGAWASVAAIGESVTPVGLCIALAVSAWIVWGETSRQDDSPRPVLATRRLAVTLFADIPLIGAIVILRSRGLDLDWDAVAAAPALMADPVWSLVCVGVLCSAGARMGFFPLSLWRGRTAALGRGPAAVAGPLLATAAGAALLSRFGPTVAADPVATALRLAMPVSALGLAVIAASQRTLSGALAVTSSLALCLLGWQLSGRAFETTAAVVLLASAAAVLFVPADRMLCLLPEGFLRRMGRRQFYLGDVVTFLLLPLRGLAQLTRFFDASWTAPSVRRGVSRLTDAVDREMEAESTGVRPGIVPILLLVVVAAAAWGAGR